jgi:RIO-like serine/threonine protein kinase
MSRTLQMSKQSKKDELPTIVSFSLTKIETGYVALKITTKGTDVVSIEKLNEPDMKPIATERFKIAVAKELL